MNTIHQEQNLERSIELQTASSSYYVAAEKLQTFQLAVLIVNALVWPIVLAWIPEMKVWSALAALLIPAAELTIIEPLQKKWKTYGAKIQELFDCSVLRIAWNDFKVGERPREEDIVWGAANFRKSKRDEGKLTDWYSFSFSDLPVFHARLICQRANTWWDSELRERYVSLIGWGVCGLGILALIIGIVTGLTVDKLILAVVAPISPICMWGIKEARKQSLVVSEGLRIVRQFDSIWLKICSGLDMEHELDIESRSFQNEIYDRRRGNAVNPQWLYWKKRDEFQQLMIAAGNQLLTDYRKRRRES